MKKNLLLLCLCTVVLMMTGCVKKEPEVKQTVSQITEVPKLIPWEFKTGNGNSGKLEIIEEEIVLPASYYIEEALPPKPKPPHTLEGSQSPCSPSRHCSNSL